MHFGRPAAIGFLSLSLFSGLALGACGSSENGDAQGRADKIVADAKAEAEQIKADAQADADSESDASAADADAVEEPAADNDSAASGGKLPNLVGKGLQYAQDASQEAGFYGLTSHDSAGRGRQQVLDRNWKVCTQSPSPGSTNQDATVDFGAVKIEESCPEKDQGKGEVKEAGERMPKLAGKSAAVAEEALPGASVDFVDGRGEGRVVLVASNWKVCAQRPAAGAAYSGVPVSLTVVKYGEGC